MPTVNLGTSLPSVSTKQGETVTWQLPSTIGPGQHLRVEVWSLFDTIGGIGNPKENKVDLKMSFPRGTGKNVTLSYKVYLVTTTVTAGVTNSTEAPSPPGPSLVIDTIGPPTSAHCPKYRDTSMDDKPGEDHHGHEDRG